VNESELTALLRRSESETLDFKSKQYPFARANDEEKSELLKDIVAMANGWKPSDGYILIGVEEKHGGATGLCGADPTLGDSEVQQFVNSKTNRPISFRLEVLQHQGANLTIIHIDKNQKRPIYLIKNFASLKKEAVYIRRGSSTDIAAPDEVAEMGKEAARVVSPDVSLEFEFAIEAWEEQQFGGSYPRSGEPKITEEDYLKIYAVNHKGGLAQHLQGSVWIPILVLLEVLVVRHIPSPKILQEIGTSEPYEIEISNNYSDGPSQQFTKPPPPDWHPFSPGKRLWLKEFRILPYRERLGSIACSIRWQISVNGGDLVAGETKFADIPLVDRRGARRY
jgi:hypothetical protein